MKTRSAVLRKAGTPWEITKKYALDEINDGYQDLMDGKNIRVVVVHQHG
jgi:Zn-dependent alcohol dehydrogenase